MSNEDPEPKADAHLSPEAKAGEKVAELRMHSELAAIFEGPRKFDASVVALDPDVARDVQRAIAKFERSKIKATPVLEPDALGEAQRILALPADSSAALTTSDYHVYRRPGEVMMVRWLAAEEVDTFYGRYQAHCDAALGGSRDDERSSLAWRGDAQTTAYLAALDAAELNAEALYFREPVRKHGICVLSTTVADEMNIRFLCGHLMGVEVEEVTGAASAPGDDATDRDLAWYFKLFSLRGSVEDVERICFFAFLQKSDDDFDLG